MENEKIGLNKTEIILCIAGIVVLTCLIVLPPVFRVAFKEKKVVEDIPDEIQIETLTCTKNNYYSDGVKMNSAYVIKHYKDRVRTYNIKHESTFDDPSPYDEQKQAEGKVSTAYNMVEGISYTVVPNDKDLKISVEEDCDLSKFKSMTVTLPGDTVETKINSKYTNKESVKEIKLDLESEGYSCNNSK